MSCPTFCDPRTSACQASLSFAIPQNLIKFMSMNLGHELGLNPKIYLINTLSKLKEKIIQNQNLIWTIKFIWEFSYSFKQQITKHIQENTTRTSTNTRVFWSPRWQSTPYNSILKTLKSLIVIFLTCPKLCFQNLSDHRMSFVISQNIY